MAMSSSSTFLARVWAFLKERWIFWLSLLLALVFLVIALDYQAREDVNSSRYAVQRLTASDPPIEIIYRQYLYYEPSNKPGAPLIARLPDAWLKTWDNANAPTVTVPLTFVSDHLMFTDAQGNPTSGQMILSNSNISQTIGTLYIRPKPIIGSAPPTATLGVILPPHTFTQPFDVTTDPNTKQSQPIFLETQEQSYLRNFLNHLLGENALALAVGIALVGWGVDWLWRRGEREYSERQRRLTPIREMMPNNPAYGLKQFLSLEREAKFNKWDQSLLDALEGFRSEYAKSKRVQQQVLQQAGKELTLGAGSNLSEILATFKEIFYGSLSFLPNELEWAIEKLQRAIDALSSEDEELLADAHKAGLIVWRHFREDALDFVRPLLLGVYSMAKEPDAKMLFAQLEQNENKSLLRDANIRQILEKHECKSKYWQYNYSWSDLAADNPVEENELLMTWLRIAHLQHNPFGCPELGSDPLLLKSWSRNVEFWKSIKANRPLVCLANDQRDCSALATRLLQQIRASALDEELHRTVFPVALQLPFSDLDASASLSAYYEKFAFALSESWCELLAQNIDAYLDLDSNKQHIVAELLYWSSKSEVYLKSRLRQAGLPDDAGGRMLLRRLHEKCDTGQTLGSPSETQLRAWFNTRPKGLDKIFLMVHPSSPNSTIEAAPFEKRIVMLADSLWKNDIVLKLFTTVNPGVSFTIPIRWSRQNLREIVNARIDGASEPGLVGRHFDEFFDSLEKPVNVEAIMAQCARGSLNRMLDLGNKILQARVNRGGITNEFDFYLTRQDLYCAVKDFRRSK
ncbi:MAG: hypothetical protein EYC68_19995 [Chloroflexota bacterium]|nr:MAG: hypothetical protein EYC68_19995 [Chloroflexota bacterium]